MAAIARRFGDAPKWAQYTSTFGKDDTCKEVWTVYGLKYDEVQVLTRRVHDSHTGAVDWDVNKSDENDYWVGVIVEDA